MKVDVIHRNNLSLVSIKQSSQKHIIAVGKAKVRINKIHRIDCYTILA